MYDVSIDDETGWITLNPKGGLKHNSTIIFMHGYTMTSGMLLTGWGSPSFTFGAFKGFASGELTPHDARIILP